MDVLYVDDDLDDRLVFKEAFCEVNSGVVVKDFENGPDLLRYLSTADTIPRYIFVDLNMPVMSGDECAKHITSDRRYKKSKIVMYSTTFSPSNLDVFKKQGWEPLQKPDRFDVLKKLLKNYMERISSAYEPGDYL